MSLVVLDTDVASTLLRRRLPDTLAHQLNDNVLAITFVTVGELTKWTLVRHWGPQRPTPTSPTTTACNSSADIAAVDWVMD